MAHGKGRRGLVFWGVVLAVLAVSALGLELAGAPSPFLFAGIVAGAVATLALPDRRSFPEPVRRLGMAVIGVAAGSSINGAVLRTVVAQPAAVAGGVVATLALSMLLGQVLRLSRHVDSRTAIFASIAGGASGVTSIAREVGADESIVVTVQYLRVLFVLATVPFVTSLLGAGPAAPGATAGLGWASLPYAATAVLAGWAIASVWRFSASGLLLPMLIATGLSLTGALPPAGVPPALLDLGYVITGLAVGFSFTPARLRQLGSLMPLALVQVVLSVGACAAVGLAFARLTGLSQLDAYLATTPGGLPAVTAIAVGSGAAVGTIVTVQLVRVVCSLLLAPAIGFVLRRPRKPGRPGPP